MAALLSIMWTAPTGKDLVSRSRAAVLNALREVHDIVPAKRHLAHRTWEQQCNYYFRKCLVLAHNQAAPC